MPYPLRDVPPKLWAQVKAKAAEEGHTIRFVILRLLMRYVREGLK